MFVNVHGDIEPDFRDYTVAYLPLVPTYPVDNHRVKNMPETGVPTYLPSATAAAIAGVSPTHFRSRFVEPGLVEIVLSVGRVLVSTASLEAAIGKPITCQAYCLAERQRDGARDYQRRYRRSHREASHAA
jgi:hypothetical protein